jgi:hypothetical protein
MSIVDYYQSVSLAADGSFYSLLMAAMRNADTDNLEKLKAAFPEIFNELQARYNAMGGALTEIELDWVNRLNEEIESEEESEDDYEQRT